MNHASGSGSSGSSSIFKENKDKDRTIGSGSGAGGRTDANGCSVATTALLALNDNNFGVEIISGDHDIIGNATAATVFLDSKSGGPGGSGAASHAGGGAHQQSRPGSQQAASRPGSRGCTGSTFLDQHLGYLGSSVAGPHSGTDLFSSRPNSRMSRHGASRLSSRMPTKESVSSSSGTGSSSGTS
ncbi:unnamed protein product, partial [Amoebophrya sp. A25]|eukprot:GSA25T00010469001.1